jgi:hypothetical protein
MARNMVLTYLHQLDPEIPIEVGMFHGAHGAQVGSQLCTLAILNDLDTPKKRR